MSMMRHLEDNQAIQLTLLDIKNLRYAANLIDKIIPVVNNFDEKVLNVRFSKALEEATGESITVENNEYHFRINLLVKDDTIIFDRSGASCGRVERVVNRTITLLNMCYPEKCPLCNKRLIAENIIKELNITKQELIKKSERLSDGVTKYQQYRDKLNQIKELVDELHEEVPYEMQEYFDLYVRVSQ